MNGTIAPPRPSSPQSAMVDDIVRRALNINDPRNADQIAAALLLRYPDVARLELSERAGLPFSTLPAVAPAAGTGDGAANAELIRAGRDLERDLLALTSASPLNDISRELAGWGHVLRTIVADGLAAARDALNASGFDGALAARAALREYGRIARYVGALSDDCGGLFRSLAQRLDAVSGLILVVAGNALASSGVSRSTAIMRISPSDVQMRRNAVVTALRNLSGSSQSGICPEPYPRGIEAYRGLIARLEAGGHADLRTLLEENALAHAMDSLIDLATGGGADGLKDLATASAVLVQRFGRIIQIAQGLAGAPGAATGAPDSPPLVSFMAALQLFVDAFTTTGSGRLLYISRPPIIAHGLYGMAGPDAGARRLIALTTLRGILAEEVDCFAGCNCDAGTLRCQIILDYLLFAVDRAIDCYAVGTDPDGKGEPEQRAAVTGRLIGEFRDRLTLQRNRRPPSCAVGAKLGNALDGLRTLLLEPFLPLEPARALVISELQTAYRAEGQIERLVRSLSSSCHVDEIFDSGAIFGVLYAQSPVRTLFREIIEAAGGDVDSSETIHIPPTLDASMERVAEAAECHGSMPGAPTAYPPGQTAPVAAPAAASDRVSLFYAVAVGSTGAADRDSPTGEALFGAGYPDVRAIATKGSGSATARRAAFVQAMTAAAAKCGPGLLKDLSVQDLERIHELAPNVQAAFDEQQKP